MTTKDDHDAVLALLERKLNASAPRDANPVATVVRRARSARRRRVLAGACAAVLVVAGLGATGELLLRNTGPSPTVVADLSGATNLRPVIDWAGETVRFHGLTLPVPDGWTVQRSSDLHGRCLGAKPKTLWLFDVPPSQQFLGGCGRPGPGGPQMWVVTQDQMVASLGGDNPVALDPSGQPVYQPDLNPPANPAFTGLAFPWLGVWLDTTGMPEAELTAMLAAVRADVVAPRPGLHLPNRIDDASYQRFGGSSQQAPEPNGRSDARVVEQTLRSAEPDTTLRCVPKVGASLMLTQKVPDDVGLLLFDTTGACMQVTDGQGGLATLDAGALRTLAEQVGA